MVHRRKAHIICKSYFEEAKTFNDLEGLWYLYIINFTNISSPVTLNHLIIIPQLKANQFVKSHWFQLLKFHSFPVFSRVVNCVLDCWLGRRSYLNTSVCALGKRFQQWTCWLTGKKYFWHIKHRTSWIKNNSRCRYIQWQPFLPFWSVVFCSYSIWSLILILYIQQSSRINIQGSMPPRQLMSDQNGPLIGSAVVVV